MYCFKTLTAGFCKSTEMNDLGGSSFFAVEEVAESTEAKPRYFYRSRARNAKGAECGIVHIWPLQSTISAYKLSNREPCTSPIRTCLISLQPANLKNRR